MAADAPPIPPQVDPDADRATDRILRIFCRFVSAGYVLYLLLLVPNIVAGAGVTAHWWTPTALMLVFVPGIALGALTFHRESCHRSAAGVRATAAACALGYLAAAALWVPAWTGALLDSPQGMWFSQFNGLASLAAVIAWRARWAFVHLLVAAVAVQVINHVVRAPDVNGALLPEIAWSLAFCLLPISAGVMAIRTGRILDTTRQRTYAAAAGAAATEARAVERGRIDALTHDGVMATMLSAARQDMSPVLAAQARSTLTKLDALAHAGDLSPEIGVTEVLASIRSAVAEVDATLDPDLDVEPDSAAAHYPRDAIRTLGAAAAEALRNASRHAGPCTVVVSIRVGRDDLSLVVADDGAGFDPDAVPGDRFGVAVSILGRVRAQPGCAAQVRSRRAGGTRVTLEWRRP